MCDLTFIYLGPYFLQQNNGWVSILAFLKTGSNEDIIALVCT